MAHKSNTRAEREAGAIRQRLGEHFARLGVDLDVDIALATGYTRERIRQFRAALGIARAPRRVDATLDALRATGEMAATVAEVASQTGLHPHTVRSRLPDIPWAPKAPFNGTDSATTLRVTPLLATHTNREIAAMVGVGVSRIAQIRIASCIPSPRRRGPGKPSPTFETIIERASCALGCDVDTLDTANLAALHRKHGVSIATLGMWRSALFNCGFFERARKNACMPPA